MPAVAVPTMSDDFLNRTGGIAYTNLLSNPGFENTINGAAAYNATGARVADTSFGSNSQWAIKLTGTLASGNGIALYTGFTGTPATNPLIVPASAGKRYGYRIAAKLVSVSGGTIGNITVNASAYDASGTRLAPSLTMSVATIANPVVGTIYNLAGYIDMSTILAASGGSTAVSLGFSIDSAVTAGTAVFEIRYDNMMIVEMSTSNTVVPAYFDGNSTFADWTNNSLAGASTSVLFNTNGMTTDWAADAGANNVWVGLPASTYTNYGIGVLKNDGTSAFSQFYNVSVNPCQDMAMSMKYIIGSTTMSEQVGFIYRLDANTYLRFYFRSSAFNTWNLTFSKIAGGVETVLSTGSSFAGLYGGTYYWLTASLQGNVMTLNQWANDPTIPGSVPAQTLSYTLTGTDATLFGNGVKGRPGFFFQSYADTASFIDRIDFFELTKQRSITRSTRQGSERVSRVLPTPTPPKALVLYNAGGQSDAVWKNAGFNTTADISLNQTKADVIAKVLAGGYTHLIADWGYAAPISTLFDAAYTLYMQYGISVFTAGNDSVNYVENPIWTGSVSTGSWKLSPTLPANVRHPITDAWKNENPQYDGDGNTYLTGVRPTAVVVGEWLDSTGARRPAIIAEDNPNGNGARYLHMEPYNWGSQAQLVQAVTSWLYKPLRQADAIYGDTDTYLTEAEVTQLKSLGFVVYDGVYAPDFLNFQRYVRNGPAGVLPLESVRG